jgi:hypothetical protein
MESYSLCDTLSSDFLKCWHYFNENAGQNVAIEIERAGASPATQSEETLRHLLLLWQSLGYNDSGEGTGNN